MKRIKRSNLAVVIVSGIATLILSAWFTDSLIAFLLVALLVGLIVHAYFPIYPED